MANASARQPCHPGGPGGDGPGPEQISPGLAGERGAASGRVQIGAGQSHPCPLCANLSRNVPPCALGRVDGRVPPSVLALRYACLHAVWLSCMGKSSGNLRYSPPMSTDLPRRANPYCAQLSQKAIAATSSRSQIEGTMVLTPHPKTSCFIDTHLTRVSLRIPIIQEYQPAPGPPRPRAYDVRPRPRPPRAVRSGWRPAG